MFYKRPSLRRGGMPTGIETIGGGSILGSNMGSRTGFQSPILNEFGIPFNQTQTTSSTPFQNKINSRSNIASNRSLVPSGNIKNFPVSDFLRRFPKRFPATAANLLYTSAFVPTGVMAAYNMPRTDKALEFMKSAPSGTFDETNIDVGDFYKEYDDKQKEGKKIGVGDVFKKDPVPKEELEGYSDFVLKLIGTEASREILREREKNKKTEDSKKDFEMPKGGGADFSEIAAKVVPNKGDKGDVDTSKDTQPGGEVVEDSFDSEYDKQMKRLEKYLGTDNRETKGRLALALSDAIGTPGSIADKAAVLNKSLLGIMGQRKKDKRELAKIAFAATTELEKARTLAEKPSEYEKRRNRFVELRDKENLTSREKDELLSLTSELGLDKKSNQLSLTDSARLTEMLGDIRRNINDYEKEQDPTLKAELGADIRDAVLNLLQAKGVNQNIILNQEPRIQNFLNLADGGRVNKAMGGGASETPAEPVATNLTFEQLRTRLPKEITDDIVRLVATSEEALQDFAYIRTQGDVEKFNVKYGVNLVLPQNTA